ncbi:hypothetical protein PHMEG_00027831 [Phytophthora megakarya]|uniref:Tc1-like transposase DDE domain-containing protein n=1 Tax=Phytophthora megakarya TaxID=4795 RepID=A0A225V6B1_9STRA|nr:hypothetical protein PHMEG_00027831 [Phytophthora megakarya]
MHYLAVIYNKAVKTFGNWINAYEETGTYQRASSGRHNMFAAAAHQISISKSSIWRIIHECDMTRKVFERRATHNKEVDVFRFFEALSHINWGHASLIFLDEVSFDNRKRGYLRKETIAIRWYFQRKPRVSVLAFVGITGVIDYSDREGTFDRVEFLKCCSNLGTQRGGMYIRIRWILDGASIHKHAEIVHILRSIGIVPIFFPAHYPFFNTIE